MGKYVKQEHRANGIGFLFTDAPMQNWGRYSNRTYAVMLLMESGAFLFYGIVFAAVIFLCMVLIRPPKSSVSVRDGGGVVKILFASHVAVMRQLHHI